jgi:hypothetical protein
VFHAEYQPEAKGRKHRGFHKYTLRQPLQHSSKSALKGKAGEPHEEG